MNLKSREREFCEKEYAALTNNEKKLPPPVSDTGARDPNSEGAGGNKSRSNSQPKERANEQAAGDSGNYDAGDEQGAQQAPAAGGAYNQGRWLKEEHRRFVEGLSLYGKNWKKVEEHVGSRNGAQIRSHAQKFFNRLEREYDRHQNEQAAKDPNAGVGAGAGVGAAAAAPNPQRKSSYNFRRRFGSFDSVHSHDPISEDHMGQHEESTFAQQLPPHSHFRPKPPANDEHIKVLVPEVHQRVPLLMPPQPQPQPQQQQQQQLLAEAQFQQRQQQQGRSSVEYWTQYWNQLAQQKTREINEKQNLKDEENQDISSERELVNKAKSLIQFLQAYENIRQLSQQQLAAHAVEKQQQHVQQAQQPQVYAAQQQNTAQGDGNAESEVVADKPFVELIYARFGKYFTKLSNLVDMESKKAPQRNEQVLLDVPNQKRRKSSFVLHHCDDSDDNSHQDIKLENFKKKIKRDSSNVDATPESKASAAPAPAPAPTPAQTQDEEHHIITTEPAVLERQFSFQPITPRFPGGAQ